MIFYIKLSKKKFELYNILIFSTSAKHRQLDDNLRREDCPLNVADKMSELYDNQWTSAMKNLESLIIKEEERIGILLKIFQVGSY